MPETSERKGFSGFTLYFAFMLGFLAGVGAGRNNFEIEDNARIEREDRNQDGIKDIIIKYNRRETVLYSHRDEQGGIEWTFER